METLVVDNMYKLFITTHRLLDSCCEVLVLVLNERPIFQIYNVAYYHDIVNFGSRAFMSVLLLTGRFLHHKLYVATPFSPPISPFPMHIVWIPSQRFVAGMATKMIQRRPSFDLRPVEDSLAINDCIM